VPILPKLTNISLQIFVNCTFNIFVAFNQYSLVRQKSPKFMFITSTPGRAGSGRFCDGSGRLGTGFRRTSVSYDRNGHGKFRRRRPGFQDVPSSDLKRKTSFWFVRCVFHLKSMHHITRLQSSPIHKMFLRKWMLYSDIVNKLYMC
jgi:hypothetical protein